MEVYKLYNRSSAERPGGRILISWHVVSTNSLGKHWPIFDGKFLYSNKNLPWPWHCSWMDAPSIQSLRLRTWKSMAKEPMCSLKAWKERRSLELASKPLHFSACHVVVTSQFEGQLLKHTFWLISNVRSLIMCPKGRCLFIALRTVEWDMHYREQGRI